MLPGCGNGSLTTESSRDAQRHEAENRTAVWEICGALVRAARGRTTPGPADDLDAF